MNMDEDSVIIIRNVRADSVDLTSNIDGMGTVSLYTSIFFEGKNIGELTLQFTHNYQFKEIRGREIQKQFLELFEKERTKSDGVYLTLVLGKVKQL